MEEGQRMKRTRRAFFSRCCAFLLKVTEIHKVHLLQWFSVEVFSTLYDLCGWYPSMTLSSSLKLLTVPNHRLATLNALPTANLREQFAEILFFYCGWVSVARETADHLWLFCDQWPVSRTLWITPSLSSY